MSEWFKELVLKTSDPARDQGFESLSLRQRKVPEFGAFFFFLFGEEFDLIDARFATANNKKRGFYRTERMNIKKIFIFSRSSGKNSSEHDLKSGFSCDFQLIIWLKHMRKNADF